MVVLLGLPLGRQPLDHWPQLFNDHAPFGKRVGSSALIHCQPDSLSDTLRNAGLSNAQLAFRSAVAVPDCVRPHLVGPRVGWSFEEMDGGAPVPRRLGIARCFGPSRGKRIDWRTDYPSASASRHSVDRVRTPRNRRSAGRCWRVCVFLRPAMELSHQPPTSVETATGLLGPIQSEEASRPPHAPRPGTASPLAMTGRCRAGP